MIQLDGVLSCALLSLLVVLLVLLLVVIGRLRLSKIVNHKSPLLGLQFSRDRLEFSRERLELNDRLKAGLRSIKFELLLNQKQSELARMHDKLRATNLNDSNLEIFPLDTQDIMFEMSSDESMTGIHEYRMSGEVSSNTDTFLEMENNNPIPITTRISIKR